MNKKNLLIIILVLTCLVIITIFVFSYKAKYNKYLVSSDEWNSIINNNTLDNNISIVAIKFNDYNLVVDEEKSTIYYSVVNTQNKYNPSIYYKLSDDKLKIAINGELSDDALENSNAIKIIVYGNNSYKIYKLVVTNYPILSFTYKSENDSKRKVDVTLEIFDNHDYVPQRVIKSDGRLRVIEPNKEYSFSLKKESLGHNERDNPISIFGMDKQNEYLIKVTNITNDRDKYVLVFINNKYMGLYTFSLNEERRIDNFERNRENNK